MKRKLFGGTTSATLPIFVSDTSSTTGAGLSLAHNAAGLVAEYRRQGQSTWTAITLVAGTLGTWSSGGWVVDGALTGSYEVGLPDAVLASGVRFVAIRYRGATNMLPVLIEIEIDAVNYQSVTNFGLTNLDAAMTTRSVAGDAMTLTAGERTSIGTAVWSTTVRGLTTFGSLIADIWANATRTLSAFAFTPTPSNAADTTAIKAQTDLIPASPAAVGSAMTLNLSQAVPTSNTAETVGDSLNASRADAFGRAVISGTTLTLYAADGVTIVRTFTLDSATAPTTRT